MVFQGCALLNWLTVAENVEIAAVGASARIVGQTAQGAPTFVTLDGVEVGGADAAGVGEEDLRVLEERVGCHSPREVNAMIRICPLHFGQTRGSTS